jgi:hypothetical protein
MQLIQSDRTEAIATEKTAKEGIGLTELNKRAAKAAAGSSYFPIPPKTPPGGGEVPRFIRTIRCPPQEGPQSSTNP